VASVSSTGVVSAKAAGSATITVTTVDGGFIATCDVTVTQDIIISTNLVRIEGGTFTMGSPSNEQRRNNDEGPQHQVTLSSFYMGKYEVTQAEYEAIMGKNPSKFKGSNLPVELITWYDAIEYCNKLSEKEGLTPAYSGCRENTTCDWNANGYRLPTEAEWEYACRAGTTTPFNTGDNITADQANCNGKYTYPSNVNDNGLYRETTMPIGSFAPNSWGLYDMHGNVWEWCWDKYYGAYSSSPQTNPHEDGYGGVLRLERVLRGGGWTTEGWNIRSAKRSNWIQYGMGDSVGFRIVRN
jgi:formylglycine-generating enzyme required for sulfatase activity